MNFDFTAAGYVCHFVEASDFAGDAGHRNAPRLDFDFAATWRVRNFVEGAALGLDPRETLALRRYLHISPARLVVHIRKRSDLLWDRGFNISVYSINIY